MKRICQLLGVLTLVGCSAGVEPPRKLPQTEVARTGQEEMLQADSRLVAQFKKIAVGMSPTEVRAIMGVEPQTGGGNVWVFKLSPASDRTNEIDWKLLVKFDKDKVVATQTTHTCLYTTKKE